MLKKMTRRWSRVTAVAVATTGLWLPSATATVTSTEGGSTPNTLATTGGARIGLAAVRGDSYSSGIRLDVQRVTASGTTFAWAEVGAGSPLVLLNGTASPMSEWDPKLLAGLAESRRVIVFDYPGLGQSGNPGGPISFEALSDWTASFMSEIGVQQADVLGWSMGGFVVQEMLRAHPERVRKAILAGTNPGGPKTKLGPKWVQRIDSDPNAGTSAYLRTNYPQTERAQRAGRAFIQRLTSAVNSGRYPQSRVPGRTYRAMVKAENPWLRSATNATELRSVGNRVLVATGKRDVITPAKNSRKISRLLPNARLKLFGGAGHSFLFQKPGKVANKISKFLG